jgi:hypothetical protein
MWPLKRCWTSSIQGKNATERPQQLAKAKSRRTRRSPDRAAPLAHRADTLHWPLTLPLQQAYLIRFWPDSSPLAPLRRIAPATGTSAATASEFLASPKARCLMASASRSVRLGEDLAASRPRRLQAED